MSILDNLNYANDSRTIQNHVEEINIRLVPTHRNTARVHIIDLDFAERFNALNIDDANVQFKSDDSFDLHENEVIIHHVSTEPCLCSTCRGYGTVVDPAIDSGGLTQEDFDNDPGFEEDYFSGIHDISCPKCKGDKVIMGWVERQGSSISTANRLVGEINSERYREAAQRLKEWAMGY